MACESRNGRGRRGWASAIAVAVVVALAATGCSPRHHDPARSTGDRSVPVSAVHGARATVHGITVTIPAHAVTRDTTMTVRTIPAPGPTPELSTLATPVIEVTLAHGRLIRDATISFPAGAADQATIIGAFYDAAARAWTPLSTSTNAGARTLVISTPHLSIFGGIHLDWHAVLGQLTDGVKNLITGRAGAPQPTCDRETDARTGGFAITSDDGDLVKWCFGMTGNHRALTITNNRSTAATVIAPTSWLPGDVTGSGITFLSVGRWLSSHAPSPPGTATRVVGPGGSIVYTIPDAGASGHATVQADILTWAFSGFDLAVSTWLAVYSKFLKVSGTADDIIVGSLAKGDAVAAGGFFGCMNDVFGGQIDPRHSIADAGPAPVMDAARVAIKCGFDTVKDWIEGHGANFVVKTVLGVISAVVGFVLTGLTAAFAGFRGLFDTLTGHDTYAIQVSAPAAHTAPRPSPHSSPGASLAGLQPFVGTWYHHGENLTIESGGSVTIRARTYYACPGDPMYDPQRPAPPGTPCEEPYTAEPAITTGRITAVKGDTATGVLTATNATGNQLGPFTLVRYPNDDTLVNPGPQPGYPLFPWCGPSAPIPPSNPQLDCGA